MKSSQKTSREILTAEPEVITVDPREKLTEYIPPADNWGSKMGLMGCGIQLLLGLIVFNVFLFFLVMIALII